MKKSKSLFRKRYMIFGLFVLLIGGISLGFAELRETLTISSDVLITKERFDVHFENQHITQGSVALSQGNHAVAISPTDNDELSFGITLNNPGDFYEFTIDIANSGNVDAKITSINTDNCNVERLTPESQTSLPSVGDVINVGSRKTLTFRVEYSGTQSNNFECTYKITYDKND